MNWITTSKGPLQLEHITRTSEFVDNGKVKGIIFHSTDGGSTMLPLAEGDWLRQWMNERAIFDSRTYPGNELPPLYDKKTLTQAQLDNMREYILARDDE